MRLGSSVLFVFLLLGIFSFNHLLAHEEGAPFSGAIIEPLKLHHAHIEDEQKINLFFLDAARDVLKHTFEMAWHYDDDFRWGSEVIIPFSNEGEDDGHRVYGLGDIEFQPLKYAFVNKSETILTAMVAITPPTGSRSKGFSEGQTEIAPHLFLDQAWRNWYVGSNQAIEIEVGHEHEVKYEYSAALAYSFINETKKGMATVRPDQWLVPQISTEFLGETTLNGKNSGKTEFAILPGINLWNPKSGWAVRFGISFPLTDEREANKTIYIQIGNHLDWTAWKKSSKAAV